MSHTWMSHVTHINQFDVNYMTALHSYDISCLYQVHACIHAMTHSYLWDTYIHTYRERLWKCMTYFVYVKYIYVYMLSMYRCHDSFIFVGYVHTYRKRLWIRVTYCVNVKDMRVCIHAMSHSYLLGIHVKTDRDDTRDISCQLHVKTDRDTYM